MTTKPTPAPKGNPKSAQPMASPLTACPGPAATPPLWLLHPHRTRWLRPCAARKNKGGDINTRNTTITEQATHVLANSHTPEQLEAAIEAQGALVQWHYMCGLNEPARIAFQTVRQLVALRTPETVERMEKARGLRNA